MAHRHSRDRPRLFPAQFRMNPDVHRILKAHAALEGSTLEDALHRIVCRALDRPDLLDRAPSSLRRESART